MLDMYADAVERPFAALTDSIYRFADHFLASHLQDPTSPVSQFLSEGVVPDPASVEEIAKNYTNMEFVDF